MRPYTKLTQIITKRVNEYVLAVTNGSKLFTQLLLTIINYYITITHGITTNPILAKGFVYRQHQTQNCTIHYN